MTSYDVGVYWKGREESQQACASRISRFLGAIGAHDSGLSHWFKKTMSARAPSSVLSVDAKGIEPLLKRNRRDIDGSVISDLGYGFSAWTGPESETMASIVATCGCYSRLVKNAVVVSFDPEVAPSLELLEAILREGVAAFDPDEGVATREEMNQDTHTLFRYDRKLGFSEPMR